MSTIQHREDQESFGIKKMESVIKKKICYAAIFKNESKNVYRCLNALKSIIDCVSICDTGSTDNTIMLIEKWGIENEIPTTVHSGEEQIFKNFGHNRTLSYQKAIKSYPDADYLLLIDADMVVKVTDDWNPAELDADCYMFEQVNPSIKYWNTRMISTKCKWRCSGVTHEYWECLKKNHSVSKSKTVWINDIGDGGSKENKFKRDIKLLSEGIEDPNEREDLKTRYKFYLANSYKDSGDNSSAIIWYDKRIKDGGFMEEVFMSYHYKGQCYKHLKDIPSAIDSYLKGWDILPIRSETLYEVSKLYREQGKNHLSMLFAEKGLKIQYPESCGLFISFKVYEYLFLEEVSIAGFYCGTDGKQKGKACIIKLLSMKDKIPESSYTLALSNAKHYGITPQLIEIYKNSKN